MSYAVCRMQKVKSAGLKGMQFHNQRERKSRTNDDTVPKTVLTEEQEEKLLAFAKADKTYSKNYD
ncbi:tyrosine-type recombinase/integrase [Enterococcus cecorum]|nr:tyrosine-type recombinase/integrase [Enterococcus cecorum]